MKNSLSINKWLEMNFFFFNWREPLAVPALNSANFPYFQNLSTILIFITVLCNVISMWSVAASDV